MNKNYKLDTLCVHAGQEPDPIRLSIGIEHIDDIINVLESAFLAV